MKAASSAYSASQPSDRDFVHGQRKASGMFLTRLGLSNPRRQQYRRPSRADHIGGDVLRRAVIAVALVGPVAAYDTGSNPVVSTHTICPETRRMRGKWSRRGPKITEDLPANSGLRARATVADRSQAGDRCDRWAQVPDR